MITFSKTYDEYQRITRQKRRDKTVLNDRVKARKIEKNDDPDMNKLENLLADLQAPALSRKPGQSTNCFCCFFLLFPLFYFVVFLVKSVIFSLTVRAKSIKFAYE